MSAVFVALLIVGGFIFLVIEMFVVPGFSVPGIAGLMMIGYGVFKASQVYGATGAVITLTASLAAAAMMIRLALRSKTVRAFGLDSSVRDAKAIDDYSALLGRTGTALSTLRPSGTAMIDGRRCDVVTDGEFIDRDAAVRVIEVDGTRIVVAPGKAGDDSS